MPGTNKDHKRSKRKDPERAVVRKVPARGAMVPGLKLLGRGVTPDKEQGSEKPEARNDLVWKNGQKGLCRTAWRSSAWQEMRFAETETLEPTAFELATARLCLLLPCSNGKMGTQCSVKEKSSLAS